MAELQDRTLHDDGWYHNTDDHWHRVTEGGRFTLVACPDDTRATAYRWQLFDRDAHIPQPNGIPGRPNLVDEGAGVATLEDAKAYAETALMREEGRARA